MTTTPHPMVLVDGQHDGETNDSLRRGQHDDENGEHLAVVLRAAAAEEREGKIVDVRGIQDELNPHQDADGVAPREDAICAEQEDDKPQHQEMV
jgi:hypothetical protein